jgi:hypothetical protein
MRQDSDASTHGGTGSNLPMPFASNVPEVVGTTSPIWGDNDGAVGTAPSLLSATSMQNEIVNVLLSVSLSLIDGTASFHDAHVLLRAHSAFLRIEISKHYDLENVTISSIDAARRLQDTDTLRMRIRFAGVGTVGDDAHKVSLLRTLQTRFQPHGWQIHSARVDFEVQDRETTTQVTHRENAKGGLCAYISPCQIPGEHAMLWVFVFTLTLALCVLVVLVLLCIRHRRRSRGGVVPKEKANPEIFVPVIVVAALTESKNDVKAAIEKVDTETMSGTISSASTQVPFSNELHSDEEGNVTFSNELYSLEEGNVHLSDELYNLEEGNVPVSDELESLEEDNFKF